MCASNLLAAVAAETTQRLGATPVAVPPSFFSPLVWASSQLSLALVAFTLQVGVLRRRLEALSPERAVATAVVTDHFRSETVQSLRTLGRSFGCWGQP
jgi:hypothetical protein